MLEKLISSKQVFVLVIIFVSALIACAVWYIIYSSNKISITIKTVHIKDNDVILGYDFNSAIDFGNNHFIRCQFLDNEIQNNIDPIQNVTIYRNEHDCTAIYVHIKYDGDLLTLYNYILENENVVELKITENDFDVRIIDIKQFKDFYKRSDHYD